MLKSVDSAGKTLTVTLFPTRREEAAAEEKTLALSAETEIGLNDGRGRSFSIREGKPADLVGGAIVTLRLSLDQQTVQSAIAEGSNVYGTLKAVDAGKNTITLLTGGGRGTDPEEKVLTVADGASIQIDDGRGRRLSVKEVKLADVPDGAAVNVKLSVDQKAVAMLRAEGPTLPALLKAVDADKNTITVLTGTRDNPEEKTLPLAKDARILVDGNEGKLADLKPGDDGPFVLLRLSLDQQSVQGIQARTSR